ncbi:MAG: phosphotransferase [Propionibacteriaceae bacterium]|nr:phosphotransferase [Propionibacteriaceae bacterium]
MSRLAWTDVPLEVRREVERLLGGPVVSAQSQAAGLSPGSADRVRLADGTRAFVKAVAAAANPDSVGIHRQEIRVLGALPPGLPLAGLIGGVDTGDWVAVVLEDVDGRQPTWTDAEVRLVLSALAPLTDLSTPLLPLPPLTDYAADEFSGWESVRAVDLPYDQDMNTWVATHLGRLAALAAEGVTRCAGGAVVHHDLRADNVLLREADGQAVLIDWPWAALGSEWFDPVCLVLDARRRRGCDIDQVLATHPAFDKMPSGTAECFLSGLAGFFTYQATLPPAVGIPGLRGFQRDQGRVALEWLRGRVG